MMVPKMRPPRPLCKNPDFCKGRFARHDFCPTRDDLFRSGKAHRHKRQFFYNTMNVFVTRHGARIDNGPDRDRNWLQRSGHGRREDAHLSPLGRQEAEELASELVRRQRQQRAEGSGPLLDHIVSSPFVRCVETADAVARALDLGIKVEPGIGEVGSDPSQMAAQQDLEAQFPRIDPDYRPAVPRDKLPRSERGDGAAARRASQVAKAVQRRLDGGSILFVGHGASCLGLVGAFGASEEYIGYCSLTQFQWTPNGDDDVDSDNERRGTWKLVGTFGDVSHLSDPQTSLDSAW